MTDIGAKADDTSPGPEPVHWRVSYERASVERFIEETERQRRALENEIEATRAQLREAKERAALMSQRSQPELGDLLLAAQQELSEMQRHYRAQIEAVRVAAQTETARVLAAAQMEEAAVRSATEHLTSIIDARHGVGDSGAPDEGSHLDAC